MVTSHTVLLVINSNDGVLAPHVLLRQFLDNLTCKCNVRSEVGGICIVKMGERNYGFPGKNNLRPTKRVTFFFLKKLGKKLLV